MIAVLEMMEEVATHVKDSTARIVKMVSAVVIMDLASERKHVHWLRLKVETLVVLLITNGSCDGAESCAAAAYFGFIGYINQGYRGFRECF